MSLVHIIVFLFIALLQGSILRERWRGWILLILSLLAVYWLQPSTPIRYLDYWLPTLAIIISIVAWALAGKLTSETKHLTWVTGAAAASVVLLISLLRYLGPLCCLTASRPPGILEVAIAILLFAAAIWASLRFGQGKTFLLAVFSLLLLTIFIILKTEVLSQVASTALRFLSGQSTSMASPLDIRWLGFSYIAFRLLHVLRDRQAGRAMDLNLQEFIIYVLFFPALSAGPIDRATRFVQDLRKPFQLSAVTLLAGGSRLIWGIFKKFVLADTLALISLNDALAAQAASPAWLWVILYAYALRIFFDFSGYTDIAIGLGRLFGIQLPENFEHPYLKPNLTAFWNSWHITLAQWFRAYFFNPLTRTLRNRQPPVAMAWIILVGQLGTMLLIGLWHGITWNFTLWGLWHGVGLYLHNRWAEKMRLRQQDSQLSARSQRLLNAGGALLTFNYVTLGWVWFALSTPALSLQVFQGLLGIGH